MLEYVLKAVEFTQGRSGADLEADEVLGLAVTHLIEIIGEAARNVSGELRDRHPEIPWDLIIGTRNRLSHGYIDVDLDIIWAIITGDLPSLIAQLECVLNEEGD